ncbi:peptide chain release factor 1 [Alkalispirochaeta sphaeroplastigenens]|uniref:Peptide chain release factor 1 n=1 Tax=Alkalispirochaeta sphaeroplastigenens TaxID=1187066 RepID=A0A2S4JGM2_9SPIO|nr:peptide chain release factor 1 [Alkalispirochaeta sphaeroplastigenens]POQ98560.1 peptide chain release factor 1 [Alkalispirochaeta sphaeroplastigenens]
MDSHLIDRINQLQARLREVELLVADPDLHRDQKRAVEIMREHARLSGISEAWDRLQEASREIAENELLVQEEQDQEMKNLAEEELVSLRKQAENTERELKVLLLPPDPLDEKNTILEIRAGTGGDEASLFASDLYRMYARYAEDRGWKIEILETNATEVGGFKEIIFSVAGSQVYSHLKYESGVHRVQRIPSTESGGRIHTSAVTVAVLPEAEETDIQIRQEDLKIDVYRSSGPGGQSVNTTDSAVRITHIPTGLVVICQDEKSQLKNKAKALRVLKARLFEQEEAKRRDEMAQNRRSQIGSGDRSERIRTYNFPQNRLSDHRINLTLYKLDHIIEGDLSEVVEALRLHTMEEELSS